MTDNKTANVICFRRGISTLRAVNSIKTSELPELKCERFVSPFSVSPSSGLFLESAISGDGHVSIPESAAILEI